MPSAEARLCRLPGDTEALAAELADELKPGDVLLLSGDLGAGKTCFTRGLARALGYGESVLSPTFQIMREHQGGRLGLFHIDLYRLGSPGEVQALGLEETFDGDAVSVVEWPERLGALAPRGAWKIGIEIQEDGTRRVTLEKP